MPFANEESLLYTACTYFHRKGLAKEKVLEPRKWSQEPCYLHTKGFTKNIFNMLLTRLSN